MLIELKEEDFEKYKNTDFELGERFRDICNNDYGGLQNKILVNFMLDHMDQRNVYSISNLNLTETFKATYFINTLSSKTLFNEDLNTKEYTILLDSIEGLSDDMIKDKVKVFVDNNIPSSIYNGDSTILISYFVLYNQPILSEKSYYDTVNKLKTAFDSLHINYDDSSFSSLITCNAIKTSRESASYQYIKEDYKSYFTNKSIATKKLYVSDKIRLRMFDLPGKFFGFDLLNLLNKCLNSYRSSDYDYMFIDSIKSIVDILVDTAEEFNKNNIIPSYGLALIDPYTKDTDCSKFNDIFGIISVVASTYAESRDILLDFRLQNSKYSINSTMYFSEISKVYKNSDTFLDKNLLFVNSLPYMFFIVSNYSSKFGLRLPSNSKGSVTAHLSKINIRKDSISRVSKEDLNSGVGYDKLCVDMLNNLKECEIVNCGTTRTINGKSINPFVKKQEFEFESFCSSIVKTTDFFNYDSCNTADIIYSNLVHRKLLSDFEDKLIDFSDTVDDVSVDLCSVSANNTVILKFLEGNEYVYYIAYIPKSDVRINVPISVYDYEEVFNLSKSILNKTEVNNNLSGTMKNLTYTDILDLSLIPIRVLPEFETVKKVLSALLSAEHRQSINKLKTLLDSEITEEDEIYYRDIIYKFDDIDTIINNINDYVRFNLYSKESIYNIVFSSYSKNPLGVYINNLRPNFYKIAVCSTKDFRLFLNFKLNLIKDIMNVKILRDDILSIFNSVHPSLVFSIEDENGNGKVVSNSAVQHVHSSSIDNKKLFNEQGGI